MINIVCDVDGIWPTISMFKSEKLNRYFATRPCPCIPTSSIYSETHVLLFSTKQHGNSNSGEVTLYQPSPSQSLSATFQGTFQYAEKP